MKQGFDLSKKLSLLLLSLSFVLVLLLHKDVVTLEIQGAHAWRQCQTMWNVRNFVRHDANILNPRVSYFNGGKENILRYEFPLMQYGIALAQKVTSESVVVTRIFLFFMSILTAIGVYLLILEIFQDRLTALVSCWLFQFSPLFYYYSWNPIPDNLALCAGVWHLYFILKYQRNEGWTALIWSCIALLIAMLAKLPFLMFGVLPFFLGLRAIFTSKSKTKQWLKYGAVQLVILIPGIMWYKWVMPTWAGNSVLTGIFEDPMPWKDFWLTLQYHLKVMFPRILLYPSVWLFFVVGCFSFKARENRKLWLLSLVLITFIYLVLEFNVIHTIHDYYMMPFLPWMFVIIGAGVHYFMKLKNKYWSYLILAIVIIAPIDTSISTNDKWSMERDGFNQDVYDNREILQNIIPNDELCIILNDRSQHVFSYNIDKMGHIFYHDDLPIPWIGDMIDNYGITHMYSDSRSIDQDPAIEEFIDTLLLQVGSVHVYKLRPAISDSIKYLPDFKKKKHAY